MVLDEEIDSLPARQRMAFVLCCLEGKTGVEAARLLGCRPGTVSSRLTRARERLRSRLIRRGLAPAAALVAGLGQEAFAAPLPSALVGTALKLVVGAPSPEMLSHVEGVLRAMFLSKLKTATLLVATLGILIVGGILTHHALQAQAPGPNEPVVSPVQAKAKAVEQKEAGKVRAVEGTAALRKGLLEAARKRYEYNFAEVSKGRLVSPEDIHLWSRRWLEARLDLTETKGDKVDAYRDHFERMKTMEDRIKARLAVGVDRDGNDAQYFRIQAELWLEQAKVK